MESSNIQDGLMEEGGVNFLASKSIYNIFLGCLLTRLLCLFHYIYSVTFPNTFCIFMKSILHYLRDFVT